MKQIFKGAVLIRKPNKVISVTLLKGATFVPKKTEWAII